MGWFKSVFGGDGRPTEADEWVPHASSETAPRGFAETTAAFEAAAAAIASPAPRAPAGRAITATALAPATALEPVVAAPETTAAVPAAAAPAWPSRLPAEMPPFPSTGPHGHRGRMREKLLERGADALADYELLEMLLFFAFRIKNSRLAKLAGRPAAPGRRDTPPDRVETGCAGFVPGVSDPAAGEDRSTARG